MVARSPSCCNILTCRGLCLTKTSQRRETGGGPLPWGGESKLCLGHHHRRPAKAVLPQRDTDGWRLLLLDQIRWATKLPRVCRDYEQGLHFEGILRRTLNENIRADADPPWYVCPGTFSAHLSRYDYCAKHGVDCHSDLSARYAECDPITSISWGIRSLLGVRPNPKLTPKKSAAMSNENAPGAFFYQQRPGDITIMTGR